MERVRKIEAPGEKCSTCVTQLRIEMSVGTCRWIVLSVEGTVLFNSVCKMMLHRDVFSSAAVCLRDVYS
jgi:hypothetical protein